MHKNDDGARKRSRFARPVLSVETLAVLGALYLALLCNGTFLVRYLGERTWSESYSWLFAASAIVVFVLLHVLALSLVLTRWTAKPVLTVLIAASPVAVYFMTRYGVVYDSDMMRNLIHTDHQEAMEFLTPALGLTVAGLGLVPLVLLWWVRILPVPVMRAVRRRGAFVLATLALTVAVALPVTKDLFATARNHRELDHMLVPASVIVSAVKALAADERIKNQPKIEIGLDARAATPLADKRRPRLLVLVVGETARADNWGLDGYHRQTTPELAGLGVVNFPDVTSCGTSTEVSVPCMFSTYGRRNYDQDAIRAHQGLLHVVDHAGIGVLWRDNQSGCKGVCDGLPMDQLSSSSDPQWCNGHRCLDEVMLAGLDRRIDAATGDLVVVLHQLGNHGPSYFERYPAGFGRFAPTCDTAELGDCTVEEVVNTYDNALLYTDHVLAETIRLLARRTDRDAAMVYVSDHGESLGEYGLYLHGMPWAIAPREQTKVPMVMWVSDGFADSVDLDRACLAEAARRPITHDWLFHTVLGLMAVSTALYDPAYDVTAACRPGPGDGAVIGRPAGDGRTAVGSG